VDTMSVRVLGTEETLLALAQLGRGFQSTLYAAAQKAAFVMDRELKLAYSHGPLHSRTGRLYRSVLPFVRLQGDRVVGGAGTPVIYAALLETGGVVHGNPWLRFQTPDGEWHTVASVTIPAFKAAETAASRANMEVVQIFDREINRAIAGA